MSRVATSADTVPEPCRIAGTWLRPFCLGHHLLFKRLALPYADAPNAVGEQDELILAIAVCAGTSCEWTLNRLLDGVWEWEVAQWTKRMRGPWYRRREMNWNEAASLFAAYLKDGYAQPPLWTHPTKGNSISLSTPWEVLLKTRLVQAGYEETDVLNGYLPGRWYDYFAVAEMRQLENHMRQSERGLKPIWRRVFYTPKDKEQLSA